MRVLLVLVALIAAPFAVGVSQSPPPFSDPANCGKHVGSADATRQRSARSRALVHGGIHGVMDQPCTPTNPPPPAGTAEIEGRVYHNSVDGRFPLAGWTVTANGVYSATTDVYGNYRVTGLPAGEFSVCVVIPDGWVQQMPTMAASCPNGVGYTFTLAEGEMASFVNFAMVQQ